MTTYTLSIEDRVGTGVNCTERAVIVKKDNGFIYESSYNPNKETGPFNSNGPFDTSFSIVHPMRDIATEIAVLSRASSKPKMKYNPGFDPDQERLFENILGQEYTKVKQVDGENVHFVEKESGLRGLLNADISFESAAERLAK